MPDESSAASAARSDLPPFDANWAFYLDIDGTLLDHAPTPGGVKVDERTRGLVERLMQLTDGALALISGRSGLDIEKLFHPLRTPLAGQHGVERRDARGLWHRHTVPEQGLRATAHELAALAQSHEGLVFEDKGLNLAMHYRLAPDLGPMVERAMLVHLAELGPRFEMQGGKMIWEIKPSGRDKGKSIAEFNDEPPFAGRTPVFIGDDVTDETAFKAVNELEGITIKVGPGATSARYRLVNAEAVRSWLEAWIQYAASLRKPSAS